MLALRNLCSDMEKSPDPQDPPKTPKNRPEPNVKGLEKVQMLTERPKKVLWKVPFGQVP